MLQCLLKLWKLNVFIWLQAITKFVNADQLLEIYSIKSKLVPWYHENDYTLIY